MKAMFSVPLAAEICDSPAGYVQKEPVGIPMYFFQMFYDKALQLG